MVFLLLIFLVRSHSLLFSSKSLAERAAIIKVECCSVNSSHKSHKGHIKHKKARVNSLYSEPPFVLTGALCGYRPKNLLIEDRIPAEELVVAAAESA